jgi:hypothetical protein
MSVVKVQGNASGTGIFTIAAPATNTDRTLTLPDQTGTILTNAGPFTANASASAGAVTIDASNNVGIGTSSPTVKLQVTGGSSGTLAVQSTGTSGSYPSSGAGMEFVAGSGSAQDSIISYNRTAGSWRDLYLQGNTLLFGTAGSERARIDSSGNLLVGATSNIGSGRVNVVFNGASSNGIVVNANPSNNPSTLMYWLYGSAGVGTITTNGSTVSYNATSDYRLKEEVQPMVGALDKVQALKPVTYKWKASGFDGQGFIAHELQEVVPDCVTGEKDAVDADGNPVYQGIDTSFLVATLTAAIQEQQALIESLTARIAALEGAA